MSAVGRAFVCVNSHAAQIRYKWKLARDTEKKRTISSGNDPDEDRAKRRRSSGRDPQPTFQTHTL